ncbi:MAG: YncE family protein [Clostridioides sp.]|jgi:DNA-binding beta-propeller fold protein YncE|nr:YncE family protein [Clostridioides sp.]
MNLYVSNYLSKSIGVINLESLKLEEIIQIGENIYPHHFFVDIGESRAYIPNSIDGMLFVIDIRSKKIIESTSVGGSPTRIILNDEDIYLANQDTDSINIFNRRDLSPVALIKVGSMPHGFDISEEKKKLYVPCRDMLVCIDIEKKAIDSIRKLDYRLWHLKIDPKKSELYATTIDGKLIVFDQDTFEIKAVLDGMVLPVEIGIDYVNKRVYVTDLGYGGVWVIDYDTKKIVDCIKICGTAQGLLVLDEIGLMFVTDTENNCVNVYGTGDLRLKKKIDVGKEPTSIIREQAL